jgi:hypothetical protein
MRGVNAAARRGSPGSLREAGVGWRVIGGAGLPDGRVLWLAVEPRPTLEVIAPALAHGLRIEETGHVPTVRIVNADPRHVLLAGSLVVSGGYQTRTLERSVLVPGLGECTVPVRCVEKGRWHARDDGAGTRFQLEGHLSMPMRTKLAQSKSEALRGKGRYESEQHSVWREVDEELGRSKVASATSSYEAYMHEVRKPQVEVARARAVQPPPDANGALVLPVAGGFWLEALPDHAALRAHADELLADLRAAAASPASQELPSPAWLLDSVWDAQLAAVDAVAGTVGHAYGLSTSTVAGDALLLDGALVHLAVGAAAPTAR